MEDKPEKRVYAYDEAGKYLGYIRLGLDDVGELVGEVYDTDADRLGALKFEPFDYSPAESLIFDQQGDQIGHVRYEAYSGGEAGGDVYWIEQDGASEQHLLHVHLSDQPGDNAEVHKVEQWGELLGSLKPENVSREELVLMGGGAALLLIL